MEKELRKAAKKGDEAALKALLDAKVVDIEAKDWVSGGWVYPWRRSSHAPAPLPDDASPCETLAVEALYTRARARTRRSDPPPPSPSPPC